MENLRKKNEAFMRVLLGLDNADLVKIQPIDHQFSSLCLSSEETRKEMRESFASLRRDDNTIITPGEMNSLALPAFRFGPYVQDLQDVQDVKGGSAEQPHLFATGDGKIRLIPPTARCQDLLFQFWDSDVVAVVRFSGLSLQTRIVGRAVLANDEYIEEEKFPRPMGVDTGLNFGKGVELFVDIRTLQLLTQ
jgi:hypothetical protein